MLPKNSEKSDGTVPLNTPYPNATSNYFTFHLSSSRFFFCPSTKFLCVPGRRSNPRRCKTLFMTVWIKGIHTGGVKSK